MATKKPIAIKKSAEGSLRSTAGVKKGEKIPVATLKKLASSPNPTTKKRAVFALNARSWGKNK